MEVLVAVAILAIVFTPLLKSFTTASYVNAKAQKTQNATSLAEKVLEEVKGKSIQELHDLAVTDSSVSFSPLDEDGGLSVGNLTNNPPYEIVYENVTATQGITYDAKVTIDTAQYSHDKTGMDETDDGYSDISDANVRDLPKINHIDSHKHAVLSWEINQYDAKALENLAAENSKSAGDVSSLKTEYYYKAEKDINIVIKEDSGMTKITCEVEYKSGNATDKTLKYLVYSGYFDEPMPGQETEIGGPNVYLFYTLSEQVASSGEAFKRENVTIEDTTTGKRHSIYLIMQDGINTLSTLNGSKISLDLHGAGWSDSISYDYSSTIPYSTKVLSGADTPTEMDDVIFCSNLLDEHNNTGELYGSKSKVRIYYVTVEIMEHGKTDVLATLTSTMQSGKEVN